MQYPNIVVLPQLMNSIIHSLQPATQINKYSQLPNITMEIETEENEIKTQQGRSRCTKRRKTSVCLCGLVKQM